MTKLFSALILLGLLTSCVTKDLAKTLQYSDNRPVSLEDIRFQELQKMKHGQSCSWNFLYFLPIFGNSSLITAAQNGEVNIIKYVGETGFWTFPFSRACTVVYGD
jgi:hypothetical protein